MARRALLFLLGFCAAVAAAALLYRRPDPPTPLPRARLVPPLFDPSLAHTRLEGPARDRWQKPAQLVAALKLQEGDSVADVGAGSGYLLRHLSRAVGPRGVVYAEEIQGEYLPELRRRAKQLGNVRVVLGTPTDPRLPEGGIDRFVLLTVYHEVGQPVAFLRSLRRAARPDAQLAIIDFDRARKGDPPAPENHELPEQDVIDEARQAGWTLDRRYEFLGSQFFLVFRLPAR
jgi:ubiquinone/menaquinone biosynthesis C-methylase UbiE